MPKLLGINHRDAVRAFQKAGFVVTRQGKHIFMHRGDRRVVKPVTNGGIIRDWTDSRRVSHVALNPRV